MSRLDSEKLNTLDRVSDRYYYLRSELLHPASVHLQ